MVHNRFKAISLTCRTRQLLPPFIEESLLDNPEFDTLLREAVDEGLSSVGDSSKQAIYFHLEKTFRIEKEEIPLKIEDFAEAIEKIFGLGANFLEILIMKHLYNKIGQGSDQLESVSDFSFGEYVTAARRGFSTNQTLTETGSNTHLRCNGDMGNASE